jgi:galactose oxidase-like protein
MPAKILSTSTRSHARSRRLGLAAFAVLLSAVSVQCGGEKTAPRPTPSAIAKAGGDGQVAPVNDPLPAPLVVVVTDDAGDPVEGVSVQWDADGAGGVSPEAVETGADGRASSIRMLGDTPGQQTTTASVSGLQGSPVTFTATAVDGLTPTLGISTQPSPAARSGVAFAVQPVVQLKDGAGGDLAESGVAVTATLTGDTGTLDGDLTRTTNATGAASFADLVLTGDDGSYTITFTAPGYIQVTSAPIALGTPTLAMKTQPSPAAVSGTALDQQPAVQLVDGTGADEALSGVVVTASLTGGTGTLGGTLTRTTDGTGAATFTNLVITADPGDYTLKFTAPGYAQITSSTIALTAAPSTIAIRNNPPTSALTGEVFDPAVQPEVQVKDGGGQPAAGVEVTARIASGGGTLEGTVTATTDASGFAKFGDLGISGTGAQTLEFAIEADTVTAAPVSVSALPAEATTGKWGPVVDWDIVPLHLSLLPTGKLLGWGKFEVGGAMGMPRLWDPASGSPSGAPMVPVDTMLFCSGHAFLADGRLMISGGHKADGEGLDITTIFDPAGETFIQSLPKMAFGRWYPTVTELTDGRMLTMAGQDSAGSVVTTPEIWEGGQWVKLPGAGALQIPYYPRNFIDPKTGLVFMAAERIRSRWFDPDGSAAGGRGRWISGPSHIWPFNREYGSAVMYEPGKILVVGGGGDTGWGTPDAKSSVPTATAEKIDLNAGTPTWQDAGSMSTPRRHMNATILPDGQVLVTGGTSGGGFVDLNAGHATRTAELWNPAANATNAWTTLAANSVMRTYHSVSLLLPDGTVLHGASGNAMVGSVSMPDQGNHEIFSPPYLFKGARPTITSAPASVGYGQTFTLATPNAAQVTDVRWIHIGTVTHAFDFGQRANTLSFTPTATGVSVTAPASPQDATGGHYLVFILNRNGVPSKGKIIKLQ